MNQDALTRFKDAQRQSWGLFSPLEIFTAMPAAELVRFAGVGPGQAVLDVGTGTGVAALTAARAGARVTALDLSPRLLERARANAANAKLEISFQEGDVEALPFADASFDTVISQFGHMFAPRPEIAIGEMLRVLKPGGRIAFSTWPPDQMVGRMFALTARHVPPPEGVAPPPQWGEPAIVRERLGTAVVELTFDRGIMRFPSLSPAHYREIMEPTLAPVAKLVEAAKTDPEKLTSFRSELDALISEYLVDNCVRQHFLMTRARKAPSR